MKYLTGAMLGPYAILEPIGGGGMATVYKAYQPTMDRFVALKVVRVDIAAQPQFRERFDREARTIARLEHRYILPVYDFGEAEGIPYLVMRYTDGGTLSDVIERGPLSPQRAIRYITQVAEALAYTHARSVIHRDIKPANILLSPDDHVLLTDFGIAKMVADTTAMTAAGMALGTPCYMAPEQVRSQPVDARTDIYALGIVLYECLIGEPPFMAETPWAVLDMHVRDPLPSPRAANPAISEALEHALLKATNKNPADRFQTAEEFAAALNAIPAVASLQVAAPPPTPQAVAQTFVLPEVAQPAPPDVPILSAPIPALAAAGAPFPSTLLRTVEPATDASPAAESSVTDASPAAESPVAAPREAARRRAPLWAWGGLAIVVVLIAVVLLNSQIFTTAPPPLFAYTFANGNADGWDRTLGWRVFKDADGAFVYEGHAPDSSGIWTAPKDAATPAMQQLSNYALELWVRVIKRGIAEDNFADFSLGIRTTGNAIRPASCGAYAFFLGILPSSVVLAHTDAGNPACGGYALLKEQSYLIQANTWHHIRAEALGSHLKLLIDGDTVLEYDDPELKHGSFDLGVGNGAIVQFADIRVVPTQ
jgi:serine/threonine protein kinase